ncbi:MAG: YajQ family cyclic di-GMP-binding protein [Candidatus Omnitrophica bacterium]|nr:YajQ family cyclic di-GMP-binding protein [Candidatus Omnitrophota bacterium]
MAKEASFDIVSEVDLQEVDNAVNQTKKELVSRFDFKGTSWKIDLERAPEKRIYLQAADGMKLRGLKQLLHEKLSVRGVAVQALDYQAEEPAESSSIRQIAKIQQGIPHEEAKKIVKLIKDIKMKVQATIQGETVRVKGKSRDDLQEIIKLLKNNSFKIPLQFTNFQS